MLPDMSGVILEWFQPILFKKVTRTNVNGEWVRTYQDIETEGVVQPYQGRSNEINEGGSWAWDTIQVHVLPDLQLKANEFVVYKDILYKVMGVKNYDEYGYVEYQMTQSFEDK